MSRTQNNDDMPVLITTSPVHFYVGVKDFALSLIFMGEKIAPDTLMVRARIYLFGTHEVYYDSNEITVTVGSEIVYAVNFNANVFTKIEPIEPIPGMHYNGLLEKDCTVQFRAIEINGMYVMEVFTSDFTVKWVVGARHIVMVDPRFPRTENIGISETNALSSETANN